MTSRSKKVRTYIQDFLFEEAASGAILVGAVVLGMVWFNLAEASYLDVWARSAYLDIGPISVHKDVAGWVESGLMALFFFVVGLELKRELVVGELRDRAVAIVPITAAIGGMAVPAILYLAVAAGTGATDGWGIPVATDIALVLGLLALLGSRVSTGLKLFMLTLAIVDDLLGIAAIALFYTDDLSMSWLLGAGVALAAGSWGIRRLPRGWVVAIVGVVVWYFVYKSGVKPALAGAAIGLILPAGLVCGRPLLTDLEDRVHPWSAFVALPLFGVTSAAIDVSPSGLADAFGDRVTWAVVVSAVVGKLVGIVGATFAIVAVGRRLPEGMGRRDVWAAGALGGVGFSVALFIASAAFGGSSQFLAQARIGVLVAGMLAATLGVGIITFSSRGRRVTPTDGP